MWIQVLRDKGFLLHQFAVSLRLFALNSRFDYLLNVSISVLLGLDSSSKLLD